MKVVVTGANSAVGRSILRCGARVAGTAISFVAAVRSERAAEQIRSLVIHSNDIARISYDDPGSLETALQGAAAVIHLPGILVDRKSTRLNSSHVSISY